LGLGETLGEQGFDNCFEGLGHGAIPSEGCCESDSDSQRCLNKCQTLSEVPDQSLGLLTAGLDARHLYMSVLFLRGCIRKVYFYEANNLSTLKRLKRPARRGKSKGKG
jgi:hypothetical protein